MRKIAIMLACFTLNACAQPTIQTHFVAQQKGEKQMATLLFDEQFPDKNVGSRGFDRQPNQCVNGTTLVHDNTLNKNVIYWSWTNGKQGMPDGGTETFGRSISASAMNNGITIYTTIQFHNYLRNGNGGGNHAPLRANPTGYLGNGQGEFSVDPTREGNGAVTYPSNAQDLYRIWQFQFHGSSPGGGDAAWVDLDKANAISQGGRYLDDDQWYELVVYLRSDNGGPNQRFASWYRPYGETEWRSVTDWGPQRGYRFFTVSSSNPYVGLGPYFHNNYTPNEQVRVYVGSLTVWSGDAMADGNLPGAGDGGGTDPGNGGGTDPEPSDPLAISNHKVSATDTTAALTWTTNKPSNSVVDYGATETRGTIARDDNNVTDHTINLSGLTANTAYYYRFSSRTADGETVMDQANSTFMTKTADNGGGTEPEPEPIEGSLDDLTDVALNNPVEGQVLMYRGGKWVNVDARPLVAQLVEEILGETSLVVNKPSA